MSDMSIEIKAWQRYVVKLERELQAAIKRQDKAQVTINERIKRNEKSATIKLNKLEEVDADISENVSLLQNRINHLNEQMSNYETIAENNSMVIKRNSTDFRTEVSDLK